MPYSILVIRSPTLGQCAATYVEDPYIGLSLVLYCRAVTQSTPRTLNPTLAKAQWIIGVLPDSARPCPTVRSEISPCLIRQDTRRINESFPLGLWSIILSRS
ncbi:hypothetical protein CBS63078_1723 [Aspergillus niger]|nr:hypothetical protein CBS12448_313 [Aspergillus niger]KAI2898973.1 hypothetical protein CBS13152_2684 [Aspergillus niger]KAI2929277.1 hypothetical protein CBS63078_1723 [Aspergillus niger]KAI2976558.1 hypothetical protein CBS147323_591 [Aspergillus niger]KAI2976905.1 hypothetical protein CBS147324_2323 [Aspergillus niger]